MVKRKIILDSDPGHDDAVAIMLAGNAKNIELLAICVEAGNQTLEKTGRNALNIAQYFNLDVPVALGENKPLKKPLETCPKIHGESGLDGFTFPLLKRDFDKLDAVSLMRKLLLENDKVTLVPTGPLTNIATLLIKYPEVKPHIEEIVLMGGSIGCGNVTPAAEFNIFVDPEAADIVFRSGLKIVMMGLDVTRKVKLTKSMLEEYKKINNKASKLFCSLMEVFIDNQKEIFGFEGAPLHDPVTIAYLIDNSVVSLKYMNTEIDISGGPSYGRTNCDQFNYLGKKPNCYVALDIDTTKYWKIIKNCLENYN